MKTRSRVHRLIWGGLATIWIANAAFAQDEKSGVAALSPTQMRDWMDQLPDDGVGASQTSTSSLLAALEKMRYSLALPSNIGEFRNNDDQKVIAKLSSLATANDAGVRFNAASILANVTDNTTLCVVLDKILDKTVDASARFNLLQTVKVVATFSTRDNSYWIRSTVNQVRSSAEGKKDLDRTVQALGQIEQFLDTQRDQFRVTSLKALAAAEFQNCIRLPSIAEFETIRQSYNVYVHSSRPRSDIEKLKDALTSAGFNYKGDDTIRDDVGGLGVDYSTQGNRKANADIAQFVADIVNAYFPSPASPNLKAVKPRPQSQADQKNFGVYF